MTTPIISGMNAFGNDVTVQDDGKIVVTGFAQRGTSQPAVMAVVRYWSDGSLDTSFGNGGKVTTDFATDAFGNGVAVQPGDGKIVVGGGGGDFAAVVRYSADDSGPEIAVEQPATDNVSDGATRAFGNVLLGGSNTLIFTVRNIGTSDLTGLAVTLDGPNALDFAVTASPAASLPAGGITTSFAVQFAPASSGLKTTALHIASNNADENPFDITLTGTGIAPEIAVAQAGANIGDGGSRDFGTVLAGNAASMTFTITNSGTAVLTGLGAAIDGPNATDFSVTAGPAASINPAGSSTLAVQFSPTGAGTKTAAIRIASNDSDENPFDIVLTGTGIAMPAVATLAATGLTSSSATLHGTVNGNASSTAVSFDYGLTTTYGNTVPGAPSPVTGNIDTNVSADLAGLAPNTIYHYRVRGANGAGTVTGGDVTFVTPMPSPGDVDSSFDANLVNSSGTIQVGGSVSQPDGKILLAGSFDSVGGHARSNFVRLDPNGTLDEGFNPPASAGNAIAVRNDGKILTGIAGDFLWLNADGTIDPGFNVVTGSTTSPAFVRCSCIQSDGKTIIAGDFDLVNGVPRYDVARLLTDGMGDAGFDPDVQGDFRPIPPPAEAWVNNTTLHPDGKVLIGGNFSRVKGFSRHYFARVDADGTLDESFDPHPNHIVYCAAVQADGKILIGGSFTTVSSVPRSYIARVSPDGSLDAGFQPEFEPFGLGFVRVNSLVIQTDGKILVAGDFRGVNGLSRNRLARLNADGTVDTGFNADVKGTDEVRGVALQADGKVLIGGTFTRVGSSVRNGFARLENGLATQSLTIPVADPVTRVTWDRGGSAPETQQVAFDLSTDGGLNWTALGVGTRISGGWELTGLNLTGSGRIRARARIAGGHYNGGSGIVEVVTAFGPEIAIELPAGTVLAGGSSKPVDFGPVVAGTSASLTFTVRNQGTADLTGLTVTKTADGTPGDFNLEAPGLTVVAPGAATTFTVTFSPAALGARTAKLLIASNDANENPYVINLIGGQATASEVWRQTYFGSPYNTGAGADFNDADGDGLVNLMEFATGSDPLKSTVRSWRVVKNGNNLEFTFTRSKAALNEIAFGLEVAVFDTWHALPSAILSILSDDGVLQQVKYTTPAGTAGKRFLRLRVTRL